MSKQQGNYYMYKYALAFSLFISIPSFSQKSPESSSTAIKDAQNTLNNPAKIKEITAEDPKAKQVDDMVTKLAGEDSKELYAISADILPVLMEMNKDNPEKALESLSLYSKDPASFLASLPPNLRDRIQKLSKKIEDKQVKKKP